METKTPSKINEVVKLPTYHCYRCEYNWHPRKDEKPRVCPKCNSPYWDRPRKKKAST